MTSFRAVMSLPPGWRQRAPDPHGCDVTAWVIGRPYDRPLVLALGDKAAQGAALTILEGLAAG